MYSVVWMTAFATRRVTWHVHCVPAWGAPPALAACPASQSSPGARPPLAHTGPRTRRRRGAEV